MFCSAPINLAKLIVLLSKPICVLIGFSGEKYFSYQNFKSLTEFLTFMSISSIPKGALKKNINLYNINNIQFTC